MEQVITGLVCKSLRFLDALDGIEVGRQGKCEPEKCSTLDGRTGAACCHLDYSCLCISEARCAVYPLRPLNCRAFPTKREHLNLVRGCGYYWENGNQH